MKITKKTIVLSLALIAASAAQAVMITGNVAFVGRVGLYGPNPNIENAVGASSWNSFFNPGFASIESADGSYSGLAGTKADLFTPWGFNSGLIENFWTINDFTFDLISSSISSQSSDGIVVIGKGILSAVGFDDTPADWYFSTQGIPNTNGRYSFSSSANVTRLVPDNSSTIALLGLGVLALGIVRRRTR